MNPITKQFQFGDQLVTMETNKIAKQATGSVVVTIGQTVVLTTVVGARSARPGQDFFPLTVNYQEKTYAAGKIPGGFFRREGRPSEKETLTCRLIDRPIRSSGGLYCYIYRQKPRSRYSCHDWYFCGPVHFRHSL